MIKFITISTTCCWCVLGFRRGLQSYDYYKNKQNEPPFYSSKIFSGCFGLICYMIPFYFPLIIYKEIYRLEVNIRGLEKEIRMLQ
jgi:hypothetical protein